MPQVAEWVLHAIDDSDFGDQRRRRRLVQTVSTLGRASEASVSQASADWAEALAIYRLWQSPQLHLDELVRSIGAATGQRCGNTAPLVLAQDTTTIVPTAPARCRELGPVGTEPSRGIKQHTSLVLTETGVPLGIGHQQFWVRDPADYGRKQRRYHTPLEGKESRVWLLGALQTWRHLPAASPVITVVDREGDVFELYALHEQGRGDFVVRLAQNRAVRDAPGKLWDALAAAPVRGTRQREVPRADGRPARQAQVTIRSTTVTLCPPVPRHGLPAQRQWWAVHTDVVPLVPRPLGPVTVGIIECVEETPPDGVTPLHWRLATSLPVASLAEAERALDLYRLRWQVERFHYVLKHGCRVERLQLETPERLFRALVTYSLIAWHLLWLTQQARQQPDRSCETAVPSAAWQAVAALVDRRVPAHPPDLATFVQQVARLGGHLGRTRDGPPGPKTLWRGLTRVYDLVDLWHILTREDTAGRTPCV